MSEISFSFAGCGFLGIYHIGVATCLQRHVPHLLKKAKFLGASAGAMIACCMMCDVPMNECVDFTLRLANKAKSQTIGAFHPSVKIGEILGSALEEVLPPNAHEICTDRLFVSVTHWSSFKNKIISKFPTRKDLIDALLMSAFVPFFSGILPPTYKGEYYIDGGLSDNLPVLDEHTILVSPFAGECDICPRDQSPQMVSLTLANTNMQCSVHNLARLGGALFPPHSIQLKDMCWQGFDDALRYLSEHNLIRCQEHLLFSHLHHLERAKEVNCKTCRRHIYHARKDQLPENIASMLDNHMQSETGLLSRLMRSLPVRLFCWCSLPCSLTFEFWCSSMLFFVSAVKSVGKKVYNAETISMKKVLELINQGLDFVLGSPIYSGPWCSGHAVTDGSKGEEVEEDSKNGASRVCKTCHRPQTYGARQRGLLQPPAKEEESLLGAIASAADVTSASVSGLATPASAMGSLSGPQQINFAFSVDFETQSDCNANISTVSSQPQLETINERVEHIHVDHITLQPETAIEEDEDMEGVTEVAFPAAVMGDHVHTEGEAAAGTAACLCPQALDTFQACLDAFQDMEAIMTLHYLDEDNKIHAETIYGLPVQTAPHQRSLHHGLLSRQHSLEEADVTATSSCASGATAALTEENTWDNVIEQSTAVKHELIDIIEEKILQPERELEERRRASSHHVREGRGGSIGHFSLQVGGSLGGENLSGLLNSLNTTFSMTPKDVAGEAAGSPHLLKSVSDASALAKKLQALKQSSQPSSEAESSAKSASSAEDSKPAPRQVCRPAQGRLGNHRLCRSLQSVNDSEQCFEPSTSFSHSSWLVKARSDGSGLAGNLQMIREQERVLEHAVSFEDVNVECGAAGDKQPAERNFVSEADMDVDLTPRQRRRMRGKFQDERLSRSQRSSDGNIPDLQGGARSSEDTHDPNTATSTQFEPVLPVPRHSADLTVSGSVCADSSMLVSSASPLEKQAGSEGSQPSYQEFIRSVETQGATSSKRDDPRGARPKLARSRSLQKHQEQMNSFRSDLETLKLEGAEESLSSSPAILRRSQKALDDDVLEQSGDERESGKATQAQNDKRKSSHRHCQQS